jgi:hypothetical protein
VDLLPGGYFDAAGRLHREFELGPLTGREEELLAGVAPSAAAVTEVLSRCVRRLGDIRPVPPAVIRELLVADRHYLLLALRRATFGDLVRASLVCPWADCGKRVSLEFSLAAVPVTEAVDRAPRHLMTPSGLAAEISFRLPTGADQEALSAMLAVNEAVALTQLLARCVQPVSQLSTSDRAEVEARMRQVAPAVEQELEAACVECGRSFVAPFDIHRFFFGELRTDATLLYQEVHYLAYHYHWSEAEIMAMTRDKRRTYIDVLADAIEVLNGAG